MNLADVYRLGSLRDRRKRVGRGDASGHGKTSCKGQKGERARSGVRIRAGFEGGQMPLYRRVPKRGFPNTRFRTQYDIVNVSVLNAFEDGAEVTLDVLCDRGIVRPRHGRLKILGTGDLERRLVVVAHAFSEGARAKIEGKGGTARVVE
ncbi:MAG: 50S ribosomal protein L15 [Planctomycetes bacterium]|nr:50S ribosomal protein L15 [Planctomycetota bacterium]